MSCSIRPPLMTSLAFERQNPRARTLNTRRALIQRPQMERLLEHAFVPNLRIQRQQAAGQVVAHCPSRSSNAKCILSWLGGALAMAGSVNMPGVMMYWIFGYVCLRVFGSYLGPVFQSVTFRSLFSVSCWCRRYGQSLLFWASHIVWASWS